MIFLWPWWITYERSDGGKKGEGTEDIRTLFCKEQSTVTTRGKYEIEDEGDWCKLPPAEMRYTAGSDYDVLAGDEGSFHCLWAKR